MAVCLLVFLNDSPYLSCGQTPSLGMGSHEVFQDGFNSLEGRCGIGVPRSDAVHGQYLCGRFPFVSRGEVQRVGPTECTAPRPTTAGGLLLPRSLPDRFTAAGAMIRVPEALQLALIRVVFVQTLLLTTPPAFGS